MLKLISSRKKKKNPYIRKKNVKPQRITTSDVPVHTGLPAAPPEQGPGSAQARDPPEDREALYLGHQQGPVRMLACQ